MLIVTTLRDLVGMAVLAGLLIGSAGYIAVQWWRIRRAALTRKDSK